MSQVLHSGLEMSQLLWVPVCFILAWLLLLLTAWSLGSAMMATVKQAKQMHKIPCAECMFFTKDYHLKCPVRPTIALSEEAINCPDYRSY